MNIGQAAHASGVTAKMIRYYEGIGLIAPRARTEAGYRVYGDREVHALRFLKHARRLGFSVDDIRRLLALWDDRSRASADVKSIALGHVKELDQRIADLTAMRDTLVHLAAHCHGDDRPDCPIIEHLADVEAEPAVETGADAQVGGKDPIRAVTAGSASHRTLHRRCLD
jgi:MerR family transcriptional regulator, copper efflux regulator